MSEGCVFCDQSWMRKAEIFIETPHCIFASTRDPGIRAQAGQDRVRNRQEHLGLPANYTWELHENTWRIGPPPPSIAGGRKPARPARRLAEATMDWMPLP